PNTYTHTLHDALPISNIPATSFADNLIKQESMINIPETMDVLNVERVSTYAGLEKNDVITLAHIDRDYLNKDFRKYVINPKKDKDRKSTRLNSSHEWI